MIYYCGVNKRECPSIIYDCGICTCKDFCGNKGEARILHFLFHEMHPEVCDKCAFKFQCWTDG